MITRPLDLEARLSLPPRNFDLAFWLSAMLIALFFGLLGSRFVLAPGLLVGADGADFALPQLGAAAQNARTAPVVVSYRRDDVILFEEGRYNLSDLRKRLEEYAKKHPGEVLLVLADRQVSMQAISDLSAMATSAGFAGIVVAGETQGASQPAPLR